MRPRTASASACPSLPFSTARASCFSIFARPLSSCSWETSTTTTSHPPRCAETWALPCPMRPQPTTPTDLLSICALRSLRWFTASQLRLGGSGGFEHLLHLVRQCVEGAHRADHDDHLGDPPVAREAQDVHALQVAISCASLEHEHGGVIRLHMLDVAEVLEHLDHRAEEDCDRLAALIRLEDDRALEDDVLGEELGGVREVLGFRGAPECVASHVSSCASRVISSTAVRAL